MNLHSNRVPALLVAWLMLIGFTCRPQAAVAQPRTLTEADLTPIPVGKDVAGLRALVALGRFKEAAARVTGKSPEAHFVRGWLLLSASNPEAAAAQLAVAAEKHPLLADLAHGLRGEALLALSQFAEAARVVASVGGKGPLAWRATRVAARALREIGEVTQARAAYQKLADSGVAEEVPGGWLGLARLEEEAGRPEAALKLLRRIDQTAPTHWTANPARAQAEAIIKARPALRKLWVERSLDEQLDRAEILSDRGHNASVVSALEPLAGARMSDLQRCRHRYYLGKAQRNLRRNAPALATLDEAVQACAKAGSDLTPWARHLAGKAHERLAKEDSAGAHYRAQMDQHPDHRLADDAGYHLVRHLLDDNKDYAGARKVAQELATRLPTGDMVPEAIFWVFLHAFQEGKYAEAAKVLALTEHLRPEPGFRDAETGRESYWRGRLAEAQKKKGEAVKYWEQTLREAPLGWYAVLAYSRLVEARGRAEAEKAIKGALEGQRGLPGWEAGAARWSPVVPASVDVNAWEQARLLARLGLPALAWELLRSAGGSDDPQLQWVSAWLLDRAGAFHLSHDILRRKLWGFRWLSTVGATRTQWSVAFPAPFEALVDAAAAESGIDRHFLWAVMREESGFNPKIESWAKAVGLLQLLVGTGEQMRDKKTDKTPITKERLQKPEVNIPLGARYLAHVKKYTGGQLALVPAGYNAGAGALNKWLKARGDLPTDLFVELIPYEEARGYTKRVVSSWATYRALYGGEKFKDPVPYISNQTRP